MRAYTRAKLIRTKLKSVSVSVSLGEINSENKNGACKFFCCKGIDVYITLGQTLLIQENNVM